MRPVIIEVSADADVLQAIIQYALCRRTGISILSGSGTISKATIRYPFSHSPALTFYGPFSLITLTGTFMYLPSPSPSLASSSSSSSNPNPAPNSNTFGITLASALGHIFGGVIGGNVVAGGDGVKVMCTIFKDPELHRVGSVNDVGEEGDDYGGEDDGGDGDGDGGGDGDNPNVGGEGGVGSSSGGAGGNESILGFNPTPLNLAPYDPSCMPWTNPRPPTF